MHITRESLTTELFMELIELVKEHNDEICAQHGELNPFLEVYFFLEEHGRLDIIVCRDEGRVVGYMVLCTDLNHHHKDLLVGTSMALYVLKEYRGKGVSKKLLEAGEEVLKGREADVMVISCPAKRDLTKYYAKLGFDPMEHTFFKKLGD